IAVRQSCLSQTQHATIGETDMNDDIRGNDMHSNWEHSPAAQHDSQHLARNAAGAPAPASAALKQIVTIRLDVDTLAWFKSAGPGYQTRINQLLREHMEAHQAPKRNAA